MKPDGLSFSTLALPGTGLLARHASARAHTHIHTHARAHAHWYWGISTAWPLIVGGELADLVVTQRDEAVTAAIRKTILCKSRLFTVAFDSPAADRLKPSLPESRGGPAVDEVWRFR